MGAGEMASWLRILLTLVEDQGLVPSSPIKSPHKCPEHTHLQMYTCTPNENKFQNLQKGKRKNDKNKWIDNKKLLWFPHISIVL